MTRRAPPSKGRRSPPSSGRGVRGRGSFDFQETPGDTANFAGDPAFSFQKALANAANFTESLLFGWSRTPTDTMAFAGEPAFSFGRPVTDSFAATDAGALLMQDYCEPAYFNDDYVGTKTTF